MIKSKLIDWLKRYLPAEILAIIGAVLGGLLINVITGNAILIALGATWGENVGYYGKIVYKDMKTRISKDKKVSILGTLKVARNLFLEFGPAEYFDSFLFRPAAMYFFPKVIGNLVLGLIIGKFAADITFYIPTIISYELRKKYIKD